MTHPNLTVITAAGSDIPAKIRSHQAEAKRLASEYVDLMVDEARQVAATADAIATGGDAFPANIREEARQLSEALSSASQRIEAIAGRAG